MHAPTAGVRFGLIKALHAARATEQMFRLSAAETIRGQVFITRKQREPVMRNEQVQIAGGRTDRTIAIEHFGLTLAKRLEPHCAAMAAASDAYEFAHSTVTDLARLRGWSTSVPFTTAT